MFETIGKLARGLVAGIAGLLVGPIPLMAQKAREGNGVQSLIGGAGVGILGMGIGMGLLGAGVAAPFGIGLGAAFGGAYAAYGIRNAIRCAYAAYHSGLVKGMQIGLDTNLSWSQFKTTAKYKTATEKFQNGLENPAREPELKLLTPAELKNFESKASAKEKEKLAEYKSFATDKCALTLTAFGDIEQKKVITVEKKEGDRTFTFSYCRENGFDSLIQQPNPKIPQDRTPLDASNVKIISGFPKWVIDFTKNARKKYPLSRSASQNDIVVEEKNENPARKRRNSEPAFFERPKNSNSKSLQQHQVITVEQKRRTPRG